MTLSEALVHDTLTALLQIQWAVELSFTNGRNEAVSEVYHEIIAKNETHLEVIELQIIGLKLEVNAFQQFRNLLKRELDFIREKEFRLPLIDQKKLIRFINEKVAALKLVMERIKLSEV
jgi:hypothetical protein